MKINDGHGMSTGDASSNLDKVSQAHDHSPHQMVVMEIKRMDPVFCLQLPKWYKAAMLSTNTGYRLRLRAKPHLWTPAWKNSALVHDDEEESNLAARVLDRYRNERQFRTRG